MRKLILNAASGKCEILIGETIENLSEYLKSSRIVIITDQKVRDLFESKFPAGEIIQIPIGEEAKTLSTIQYLYEEFLRMELDRSCFVVAIGGGAVCDVAGFASSTYLRGLRTAFVPTTLVAQADAAVGGKNGVNFHGYKNLIGTIRQPELVLCDLSLLKSLPSAEINNGLAEIIKCASIADSKFFSFLEEHIYDVLSFKKTAIEKCIHDSLAVKIALVEADEKEQNVRRLLNFGHTFGHAIEKVTKKPHGESIGIGMALESALSVKRGYLSQTDADRIQRLLEKVELLSGIIADAEAVLDAIRKDKKRHESAINFVFLKEIGKAFVDKVELSELEGVVHDFC
ncbi:MAG: 3-dehydroquinate synthase [Candidatus Anstonellaceae archaeon]